MGQAATGWDTSVVLDIQEFVDRSRKLRSIAELEAMLDQIGNQMSFDHYALIHHVDHRSPNQRAPIRLENYPESWVSVFLEQELYSWDPIHMASYATNVAFAWSDVPDMIKLSNRHKSVLKAAAKEGLGDGFTVPANLPGEANGSCSFAVKTGRSLPRQNIGMVQLVGSYAFQAARDLSLRSQPRAPEAYRRVKLTPRQLDCIVLAGRGKSDAEIGMILAIKESTVKEYIETARDKYDVRKRIQLVMRAVHDGHIALTDVLT